MNDKFVIFVWYLCCNKF